MQKWTREEKDQILNEITTQCKKTKLDVSKERLLDLLHYTGVNLFWRYTRMSPLPTNMNCSR